MRAQRTPSMRWSSRSVRAGAGFVATLFAMSVFWGVSASAQGAETIPVEWDGPTINLAWDQGSYATASGSIVGNVVVVPGDRAERTAIVQNGGPSPACVTVQISNVTATNAPDTINTDLETLIHLFWDINGNTNDLTWREVREMADPNGVSYTVSFHLSQGEKFRITAGYYFPSTATTGKNQGVPSSVLSFDVRIFMQGDDHVKVPTGGTVRTNFGLNIAALMVVAGIGCLFAARLCGRYVKAPSAEYASVAQR